MPSERSPGKPATRRYSQEERAAAVRMARTLRTELGHDHGTVRRVAEQLGYGTESVRLWVRPSGATLTHVWIDLTRCTTAAETLDAIVHASRDAADGGERDDAYNAGLVRAIDDMLDPMASVRTGGWLATLPARRLRLIPMMAASDDPRADLLDPPAGPAGQLPQGLLPAPIP